MRARHSVLFSFVLLFGLLVAATASPAWAQGDPRIEARTHYMNGKSRFDAGDFRGAIAEFSAADNLAPSAVNDFNIALAYERLDDPAQAVRYYRSYLDRMPNAPNRAEVEAALARLDSAAKSAAAKAEADRVAAEEARKAEEARMAEEARRLAEANGGGGGVGVGVGVGVGAGGAARTTYPPTGDPDLDRVAGVDLAVMRGASPLPAYSGGGGAAAGGAAGGGAPPPNGGGTGGDPGAPPPVKKSKPFYKSPVFWVVAAVGLYVLIVLAQDDTSNQALMMPLPDGPAPAPAGGGGATLFRF